MTEETLENRIASALTSDTPSCALATLLDETETAIEEADQAAKRQRKQALDLVASPDARAARDVMAEAEFRRDRLTNILPRLEARYDKVAATENHAQWLAKYEAAKVRRDTLADEFALLYPQITNQLTDLLRRIEEVDRECSRINGERPAGERRHLLDVELTARGIDAFARDRPSIAKELKLPDFQDSARMLWPPRRVIDPALFGPVPYNSRYSSDWAEARKEQVAAQEAEQERVAAYYADQQRAREQREKAVR